MTRERELSVWPELCELAFENALVRIGAARGHYTVERSHKVRYFDLVAAALPDHCHRILELHYAYRKSAGLDPWIMESCRPTLAPTASAVLASAFPWCLSAEGFWYWDELANRCGFQDSSRV